MDFLPVFAERHDSRFSTGTGLMIFVGNDLCVVPLGLQVDLALRNGMIAVPYGCRFYVFCRERPRVVPFDLCVDLAFRNGMIAVSLHKTQILHLVGNISPRCSGTTG